MTFQQIFHQPPETQASASGRVNLLGEHTDCNDGFVLPTAIPKQTTVELGLSDDRQHQFYSENLLPLNRRARHLVTENNRVLEVLQGVTPEHFGELMNASHASLRDDYEVSVPALDKLVEILQKTPGVFGARLTGAGFGGACVALVALGEEQAIASQVLQQYKNAGYTGQILVLNCEVSDADQAVTSTPKL